MYYLFMDLEATDKYAGGKTGESFTSGITEIAGIIYDIENDLEIDRFHKMCYPKNRKMSEGATEATGYTDEYLSQFENEEDVILEFFSWIAMNNNDGMIKYIVGHNFETFDNYLIRNRGAMFGYVWPLDTTEIIDTYKHAKGVKSRSIPKRIADTGFRTASGKSVSYTQESIAKFYGIEYDAHKAINDIEALIKIFKKMFGLDNVKARRRDNGF